MFKLNMNLQFFGEAETTTADPQTNATDTQGGTDESAQKYSLEDVQRMIQQEADRRVNQALNKQKRQFEKQLSLANLDEKDRSIAEKDIHIQELTEQLREYEIMKNKTEIVKVLTARNLNPQFADLIAIGSDITEAQAKIDALDKLFKNAVRQEVEKRIATTEPKGTATTTSAATEGITKEAFRKMNLSQQMQLFKTNRELYEELTRR